MPSNLRWKLIVIAAVILSCVFGIVQLPKSTAELAANWNRNIRLGLDLQGGSHIVLQIQVQDAFRAEADLAMERLKEALSKERITYDALERNEPHTIETADTIQIHLRGVPAGDTAKCRQLVTDTAGQEWNVASEANGFRLNMRKEAALKLRQDTLVQSMHTIEKKVNGLGVAEASVQQRGGSGGEAEILVQLPGVDDPARVKSILQTSAMLELCEVKAGPFASKEAALSQHGGVLPLNSKLVPGTARAAEAGAETWWLLSRSPVVTGRDLRDARPQQNENPAQWDTGFVLTQDAAKRFERYTEANVGQRLAIVLDQVVISAPRIDSKISDQGRIMGAASQQEASDLALNLRAGSLPASVKVLEERTVGPSLGADSIRQGLTAGLVGLALVVASMVLYYRGAGGNAVVALLLNTLMTIAALSYLDATWTLPGIAGLVLSIGMAVDSNVLIFERIKEEIRAGKAVASGIAAGFDRALVNIIDTHVTTVVASAFLFLFGTGPVRGFAVTLVIGLVANLFTAVFVSRTLFQIQTWLKPRMTELSIGKELFRQTNIDFLSRRNLTLGLSLLAILISVGSFVAHGGLEYGLDFRGGTLMYVKFEPQPSTDDLRGTLSKKLNGEFTVQESRGTSEFIIGTPLADESQLEQTRQTVETALRQKYETAGGKVELRSVEMVGPRAGEQLRRQALLATLCALGGMLAYIAFRFKWISGTAAVIATVHDVVITLGLFSITGREIDLNIIAALLTLIGYSMNDKIVVFDRVRENQAARGHKGSFLDLVNLSINQTLSRTILTAGPTLLACLALYFLGGPVLNGIAFALFVGIIVGTYSSIFVASALLVWWEDRRNTRRPLSVEEPRGLVA